MSAKYYTQFILTDADYRDGNEFCGIVELNQPMALGTPIEISPSGVVLKLSNDNATFLPPFPYGQGPPPA